MTGSVFKHVRLTNKVLLDAVKQYTGKHGYSPTIRGLAKIAGAGIATVQKHLSELIYGGYIKVEKPRRRFLCIVKEL